IYDPGQVTTLPDRPDLIYYPIRFDDLVKEKVQSPKSKNVFAVAALSALYGIPAAELKKTVAKKYRGKNPKLLELNDKAVDAAYEHISTLPRQHTGSLKVGVHDAERVLLNGNDAIALGALVA